MARFIKLTIVFDTPFLKYLSLIFLTIDVRIYAKFSGLIQFTFLTNFVSRIVDQNQAVFELLYNSYKFPRDLKYRSQTTCSGNVTFASSSVVIFYKEFVLITCYFFIIFFIATWFFKATQTTTWAFTLRTHLLFLEGLLFLVKCSGLAELS